MNHFSGYGAYMLFLALRTHFTNIRYDFFQMHGKLRATKKSYLQRNDKSFFERLAKEYNSTELRDFYLANILEDKYYITEMINDEAKNAYDNYTRRRQSLSYIYTDELGRLFDKGLQVPFTVNNNSYPRLVLLFLRREISIETLVILNDFTGFTSKFDKYYDNDVIWPRISRKINKYKPFLKYDKEKMTDILKIVIKEVNVVNVFS